MLVHAPLWGESPPVWRMRCGCGVQRMCACPATKAASHSSHTSSCTAHSVAALPRCPLPLTRTHNASRTRLSCALRQTGSLSPPCRSMCRTGADTINVMFVQFTHEFISGVILRDNPTNVRHASKPPPPNLLSSHTHHTIHRWAAGVRRVGACGAALQPGCCIGGEAAERGPDRHWRAAAAPAGQ